VRQRDDLEPAVVGRPFSLRLAYLAISAMLANTRLSKLRRPPGCTSIVKGRNWAKDRTTDTISLNEPFPPFSKSMATIGVRPIPM
jgi:hypothetical protein